MEEKSKIEELRDSIEECKGRINSLETQLETEEYTLMGLHTLLFYAQNGMVKGQHFMFEGVEYGLATSDAYGHITIFRIKKNGEVSRVGKNIYSSDYGRIVPIPMEK